MTETLRESELEAKLATRDQLIAAQLAELERRSDYWDVHRYNEELRGRIGVTISSLQKLRTACDSPVRRDVYDEALAMLWPILEPVSAPRCSHEVDVTTCETCQAILKGE